MVSLVNTKKHIFFIDKSVGLINVMVLYYIINTY